MTAHERQQLEHLHSAAMDWADRADRTPHGAARRRRFEIAARLEQVVASAIGADVEPSHSILLRSAASLFLRADLHQLATQAAARALRGGPPAPVRADLLEILNEARATPTEIP